jgi:uncharacterized protein (DUF433 family)
MQVEDYFDFISPHNIRIKGHRVGIEHVLYEYVNRKRSPEDIAACFPTLTLEEVYATILYYLHNRDVVDKYLYDWIEAGRVAWLEQRRNPSPGLVKLRERMAAMRAEGSVTTKAVG